MKFRIIGTVVVLAILGALFVVTSDSPQQTAPTNSQQSDPVILPLKIQ